jgi:hypothetical protein
VWDEHSELLSRLLYIGGAFAPSRPTRSAYLALLRLNHGRRLKGLCSSWAELLGILRQFIWSRDSFSAQVQAFLEELLLSSQTVSSW